MRHAGMSGLFTRVAALAVLLIVAVSSLAALGAEEAKPITYDDHVSAILKKNCLQCHGESKQEAGLNLASYASVVQGGSGGAVVVAGRSAASRMLAVISAEDPDERMPPDNDPLPADQVAMIKTWIDTGLRQNSGSKVAMAPKISFTPTGAAQAADGPAPVPEGLPEIKRTTTIRPFPVLALAASPRAPLLAVASYEAIDFINPSVEPAPGARIASLPFAEGEPNVLRFSRSGAVLLAAGGRPVQNGVAVLYDVKSGNRLGVIGDEPDAIIAADISADERNVAIGGSARKVKIFSTADGSLLHTLEKHTDWITAVAFSPDGKLLASGDRIGNVHLWEASSGGVVLPLSHHKASIRGLSWRSDSKLLASCGEDGAIVWWDVTTGFPVVTKENAHPPKRPAGSYGKIASGVLDVAFGPKGELATCGRDHMVRLWAEDGRELKSFSIDPPAKAGEAETPPRIRVVPTRVAISFDGTAVIAGDTAGQLHTWKTQ